MLIYIIFLAVTFTIILFSFYQYQHYVTKDFSKLNQKIHAVLLMVALVAIEFLATTTLEIKVVENSWDKLNHFFAFGVLYFLLSLTCRELSVIKKVAIFSVYAVHIEVVQSFIDGRFFSLLDIVADMIGVGVASLLFLGATKAKLLPPPPK